MGIWGFCGATLVWLGFADRRKLFADAAFAGSGLLNLDFWISDFGFIIDWESKLGRLWWWCCTSGGGLLNAALLFLRLLPVPVL